MVLAGIGFAVGRKWLSGQERSSNPRRQGSSAVPMYKLLGCDLGKLSEPQGGSRGYFERQIAALGEGSCVRDSLGQSACGRGKGTDPDYSPLLSLHLWSCRRV